jgi:hypothetical protein
MRCGCGTWKANLRIFDDASVSSAPVDEASVARVSATREAGPGAAFRREVPPVSAIHPAPTPFRNDKDVLAGERLVVPFRREWGHRVQLRISAVVAGQIALEPSPCTVETAGGAEAEQAGGLRAADWLFAGCV